MSNTTEDKLENSIDQSIIKNKQASVFKENRTISRKLLRSRAAVSFCGGTPYFCRCLELSSGGMSVSMDMAHNAGDFGVIVFEIPCNGEITSVISEFSVVQCVFSNGYFRIGIQFCNITNEAKNSISKFLR